MRFLDLGVPILYTLCVPREYTISYEVVVPRSFRGYHGHRCFANCREDSRTTGVTYAEYSIISTVRDTTMNLHNERIVMMTLSLHNQYQNSDEALIACFHHVAMND